MPRFGYIVRTWPTDGDGALYLLVRANHFCYMPRGFLLHATHILHFTRVVDGRGWGTVPPCRSQRQHAQLLRASPPDLFQMFPDKSNTEFWSEESLCQIATGEKIAIVFENIVKNLDPSPIQKLWEHFFQKCEPQRDIPKLFKNLGDDLKIELWGQFIVKCNTENAGELFSDFPDSIKSNQEKVIKFIIETPVLKIPRIFDALSGQMKEELAVRRQPWRTCRGTWSWTIVFGSESGTLHAELCQVPQRPSTKSRTSSASIQARASWARAR